MAYVDDSVEPDGDCLVRTKVTTEKAADWTHVETDDNWPSEAIHVNGDKEATHPKDPNLGVTT